MRNIIVFVFITGFALTSFAKTANTLCNGATGAAFSTGDGSTTNPYLICNNLQFNRLSTELVLLSKNFKLGADLNFSGMAFNIIGSDVNPFQASFNGDGYTLSNITLTIPSAQLNYIAPFGYLKNANISNLNINGLIINASAKKQHFGGIAGYAENSTLTNVQLTGLTLKISTRAGGLVGYAVNCTIQNCSTSGNMALNAYSSGVAGLIGRGDNCRISSSYSNVKITDINSVYLGSKVGGLFGYLVNSQVSNVYSQGSIDFSNVSSSGASSGIGGIVGIISGGSVTNSFFAGIMLNMQGTDIGGAVGALVGDTVIDNLIWNQISSNQVVSAAGTPSTTCLMTTVNYWLNFGFSNTLWKFTDGTYPKLAWQP